MMSNPGEFKRLCAGLGLVYLLIGVLCAETVLQSARRHATLALT